MTLQTFDQMDEPRRKSLKKGFFFYLLPGISKQRYNPGQKHLAHAHPQVALANCQGAKLTACPSRFGRLNSVHLLQGITTLSNENLQRNTKQQGSRYQYPWPFKLIDGQLEENVILGNRAIQNTNNAVTKRPTQVV